MRQSFFSKYHRTYKEKYLLQRILFLYSLAVISFSLIVFSISATYYLSTIKQRARHDLERVHERVSRIAEDKERQMGTFTDSINNNKEAMDDIVSYFSNDYSNYIEQKLTRYYLSDSISGIDFKSSAKTFFANDSSYQYSEISQQDDPLTYSSDNLSQRDAYFITSRPLNFSKNTRQIGTIKSYFDFSDFDRVIGADQNNFAIILSPVGQVVWHGEGTPKPLIKGKQTLLNAVTEEVGIVNVGDRAYYLATYLTNNNTTLLTLCPVPTVRAFFTLQPLLVIGFFLLTVTFFITLLLRLFSNYTGQIDSIVAGMSANSHETLTTHIPVTDKEAELRTVSETFNQLIDNINDHIDKSYVLELKQKDAELRALQSQINPHFLYNTLEFIRMSALKDGNEDLSEMVYILGQLFRNNITQQKETTLYEEVESSILYMKLFQTKHPNKIAYQFRLAADCEQLILPKFIIQPLIENYVLHGVDYKKNNNVIQLKAYQSQQRLTIEITDNGKGITPDTLAAMTSYLDHGNENLTSVGFKNVNERLKIFFGENYQMTLTSEPNVETKIRFTITLPKTDKTNSKEAAYV